MGRRIGFVSTRFAGTDGVSLESAKWAQVLWHYEHFSYLVWGRLDRDPNASMLVPEACFAHPDNVWINQPRVRRSTRERRRSRGGSTSRASI